MKIAAITMVYRDYWALSQWYAHYSRYIGSDHLFVVAHGYDPMVSNLCPNANVITVSRNDFVDFDRKRNKMLNSIQRDLSKTYDWTLRTDVDELICIDPAHHSSFASLLVDRPADAVFALGLDIVEQANDAELAMTDSVFDKRSLAVFSSHYSKAWAARNGAELDLHGVMVGEQLEIYPYDLPQGVYMAHLKYANIAEMTKSNQHRRRIARKDDEGGPGRAWSHAADTSKRFFDRVEELTHMDWAEASRAAYQSQDAKPDNELGLLRSRFIEQTFKTTLPKWFGKPD